MLLRKIFRAVLASTIFIFLLSSCSNQKNTKTTRAYHAVNTRYNIYFNANEGYKEALKSKNENNKDNLSEMISVFPYNPDAEEKIKPGGPFDLSIEKCVKAIKLHSIQVKPERNPSKRGNEKYQEWLNQREFNPFLKNAWLLMGKSEFQNDDYLQAIATFSYITRLYQNDIDVFTEARLWIALAYTQMGWFYEADNIFHQLRLAGGVPDKHKDLFSQVYANYLVRNRQFDEAIPYLERAIKSVKGVQSIRLKYLLAQVYAEAGYKQKAFQAYGRVSSMNAPYIYDFNAKIRKSELSEPKDKAKIVSMLKGMSNNSKNKDYLDQVYFAMGKIYLQAGDTAKAIENYNLAIKKSTRNAYDKAMAAVALGDIYFLKRDYVKAQPCYSDALGILNKKHPSYQRVSMRSEVLDALVVHVETVQLQDSLQHLARLPEADRLLVINKLIEDLKKKEVEAIKQAEREASMSAGGPSESILGGGIKRPSIPNISGESGESTFYFYNSQAVAQGKLTFQNQWGNRKLEDNWRRTNKRSNIFGEEPIVEEKIEEPIIEDENTESTPKDKPETDVYKPAYYLQQLPLTPQAIAQSNFLIEDALFQMGGIYKSRLEDLMLAIDAYNTTLTRFPDTRNLEEIYYQLFLIYSQLGNKTMADNYRAKLINDFASGSYAVLLSDPNYEWNMRNMGALQDSLYEATYDAYLRSNKSLVRANYELVKKEYSLSPLLPKFIFLNALTYAQTNQPTEFKNGLTELIEKYPDDDATPLASEMLKGLLAGRPLSKDGSPTRGMIWDIRLGEIEFTDSDSLLQFTDAQNVPYQLLFIFESKMVNKNQLIYDVADYNFSNFILQTFDLNFNQSASLEMLQVKGFDSFNDMREYINKAFEKNSLIDKLDARVTPVPISDENYAILMRGKSLNDYFGFFVQHFGSGMPKLVSFWKEQVAQQNKAIELAMGDTIEVEADVVDEDRDEAIEVILENIELATKPKETPKANEKEKDNSENQSIELKASDLLTDEQKEIVNTANEIANIASDIMANPVDGIKNLLQKNKNKPKLSKEEKAELKEEKRQQKELEKEQKAKAKMVQDSIRLVEKQVQDSIQQIETVKIQQKKEEDRLKKEAVKEAENAKNAARKQKQDDLKAKEQARKDRLKQVEKERRERQKQRELELKEKEKERNKQRNNKSKK